MKSNTPMRVNDENGSVMVLSLLVIAMLSIIGLAASQTSITELLTLRNVILDKQDFYITDGSIYTVARAVDQGGPGYTVTDIDTPIILTAVSGATTQGALTDTEWQDILDDFDDTAWPVNDAATREEHAFRVVYRGPATLPKGFSAKYSAAYMYEITSRKQETSGGATENRTVIDTGHRKIGPKAAG